MKAFQTPRPRQIVLFTSFAVVAVFSALRLAEYDPIPGVLIAVFGLGTFLVVGPFAWFVRNHLSEERRKHLSYIGGGLALLFIPLILGFGLISGKLLLVINAATFGGIIGFAVALLIEKIVILNGYKHLLTKHNRLISTSPPLYVTPDSALPLAAKETLDHLLVFPEDDRPSIIIPSSTQQITEYSTRAPYLTA